MVNTIRVKVVNLFIAISMLSVMAAIIIMAVTANEKQLSTRRLATYKHPIIVLEVDNTGCQSKIEMRTWVAVGAK